MLKYLKDLPPQLLKVIESAKLVSSQLRCRSYLVGGFVRDLILGRKNFDLDITVEADGMDFANLLALYLKAKVIHYHRFSTATVVTPEGFKIDIATTRKESYPQPALLPYVEKGDIKDDLARRDFTINALAIGIYPEREERIIDFFGGYNDILRKKIRILHDKSFIDDPTRILRAIRFEQRFNFRIERHTLRLIKEAVSLKMFEKLSIPRLKDEFILLLKEDNIIKIIKRVEELIKWDNLIPLVILTKRKIKFLNSIKRTIGWYKREFPHKRHLDEWLMYLIGLLDGLDKIHIDYFLNKFSLRKGETKRIMSYITRGKELIDKLKKKIKPSIIYRYLEPLSYEVILLLKAKSKEKNLNKNIDKFFKVYNNVRLNISGRDLKKLGITEGPCYQVILNKLLYAKLDRGLNTKEEEMRFIKNIIGR
ncbi:MAG: hypothetical protein NC826_02885 [Candidatus Omnitrophica bacterium]|nr:hypothetical protein [Candidatus Omnitrophota bacterium]